MAATFAGAQLTVQHRSAQLAVRAVTLRQVLGVWPAFDPQHIATSWPPVENALMAIIGQRRTDSATTAAAYFQSFRAAERIGGTAAPVVSTFGASAAARAQTSLQVTGFVTTERLTALRYPDPARTALVRVSGAVVRHVLDGGRETLIASVRADRRALGWARATSGNPCSFCAMLASRGPAYGERTGDFQSHDHCACSLEPVYRRDQEWPPGSRRYQRLWADVADGLSGAEARLAFREALGR